jgi:hypothetical protein
MVNQLPQMATATIGRNGCVVGLPKGDRAAAMCAGTAMCTGTAMCPGTGMVPSHKKAPAEARAAGEQLLRDPETYPNDVIRKDQTLRE